MISLVTHDLELRFANMHAMSLPGDGEMGVYPPKHQPPKPFPSLKTYEPHVLSYPFCILLKSCNELLTDLSHYIDIKNWK